VAGWVLPIMTVERLLFLSLLVVQRMAIRAHRAVARAPENSESPPPTGAG
jgi:hypothetical protein